MKTRKQLKNALDRICPLVVKERDGWTCQRCNTPARGKGCHWSHVFGRRKYRIRWDLLNGVCLCAGCHRYFHSNPMLFTNWFGQKFHARYLYLIEQVVDWDGFVRPRHNLTAKVKDTEMEQWLAFLKEKLKELKGE